MVIVLAVGNWLAGAGVLAVGILATGAAVPWHDLLLAYGAGIAAQSLSVTPGGFGVTGERSAWRWSPPGCTPAGHWPRCCCTAWSVSGLLP